jgi:hypothetical protein
MDKLSTMLLKFIQQDLPSTELAQLSTTVQTALNQNCQAMIMQQENVNQMILTISDLMDRVRQLEQRPTQDSLDQHERQSAQQSLEQQLRAHSTQRQQNQLTVISPQSMTESTDEPKTAADFHDDEPAILVTPELAQKEPTNGANHDKHTAAVTTTARTATATSTTKAATTAMTARWLQQPLFTLVHYPRPWDLRQADYAEYQPDDESSVKLTFQHRMWTSRLSKIDRTMHEQIVAEAGVNYWDSTEDEDSDSTEDEE